MQLMLRLLTAALAIYATLTISSDILTGTWATTQNLETASEPGTEPLLASEATIDRHGQASPLPAQRPLANFAGRADLEVPSAALADVPSNDNPWRAHQVLRLSTNGPTVYTIAPATALAAPIDIRSGYTVLPFKPVSYCETVTRWSLEFHSEGTPARPTRNYHQMDPFGEGPSALKAILTSQNDNRAPGRWQYFGVSHNDLKVVGTGANLGAIKFVRLTVRGGTMPMVIELGSPYFQPSALTKAKAIITFDDGYSNVAGVALPLLRAHGFKGMYNLGALHTNLNAPGRLTVAQIHTLKEAGWQWMQQAYSTEALAPYLAMTEAERDAEMKKQRAFALENKLGDAGMGSYFSQVGQNQAALYGMFARHQRATRAYFSPRNVDPPDYPLLYGENYPFIDRYMVKSLAADVPAANFNRLTQHAEQAIANRGVAIYTFHNSLDNLPRLVKWLAANRDRIEVTTEAELAAGKL